MANMVKIEHPEIGHALVLEESVPAWATAGWAISEEQPVTVEELEIASLEISARNQVLIEAEDEADVTPVGDSEENTPDDSGDENVED